MQGNQASSFSEREVWLFFSSCSGKLGYVLQSRRGKSLKTFVISATSGLLSTYDGHLRNLTRLGRTIRMLLEVRQETKAHFLFGTVKLGFLFIFKKSQASSPFEAFNSVCLSRYQSDVIPLSRWGGELLLYLWSAQGIQTSLHLVRWNTSLNLRRCREIRPSFESGSLAVHSSWDRKHRVPLPYLLLKENSTRGAGGTLAQIFN